MPNLLITGGAGFIGANFTHYWLARHPEDSVVVLDALTYAGNLASLDASLRNPRLTFIHGNIGTPKLAESLLRDHAIAWVVHLAAESHVDRSISGPDPFLETNVLGTHALLKAARQIWLEEGRADSARFLHVSTDEVYGALGPNDPPFTEQTPYSPSSPYAASKAASDHLVRAYHRTYGLPVLLTNSSNNYGPYQYPEKLVPLILIHALEGKPLPIYGSGLQLRDWLYVEDNCRAIETVISAGRLGQAYNVGGQTEITNLELVLLLCDILEEVFGADPSLNRRFPQCLAREKGRTSSSITHIADRPGHDWRYAMSNEKIERETGFRPQESLRQGLRRTVEWYLEHEDWWRRLMDVRYREWIRKQYGTIVSL